MIKRNRLYQVLVDRWMRENCKSWIATWETARKKQQRREHILRAPVIGTPNPHHTTPRMRCGRSGGTVYEVCHCHWVSGLRSCMHHCPILSSSTSFWYENIRLKISIWFYHLPLPSKELSTTLRSDTSFCTAGKLDLMTRVFTARGLLVYKTPRKLMRCVVLSCSSPKALESHLSILTMSTRHAFSPGI